MATKVWYVNPARTKVVVVAGVQSEDIWVITQVDDAHPTTTVWKSAGQTVTSTEATFANAGQGVSLVPTQRPAPDPVGNASQPAATAATDAELTAGLALKQDEATAATDSELSAGLALKVNIPGSLVAIANPTAPGVVYTQAEAASSRTAIVSIIGVLRTAGLIQ